MRSGIIAASYMRGEPFVMDANITSGAFSSSWRFIGSIKVDWGDGTTNRYTSNGLLITTIQHTYASPFLGEIRIIGTLSGVSTFSWVGNVVGTINVKFSELNKFNKITSINFGHTAYKFGGEDINMLNIPTLQSWATGSQANVSGTISTNLTSLQTLNLNTGPIQQLPDELVNLESILFGNSASYQGTYVPETYVKLKTLTFNAAVNLISIPTIAVLENINIVGNNTISELPSAEDCPNIKLINIVGQNTITSVPEYPNLEQLSLRSNFNVLSTLPSFPNLRVLNIHNCTGNLPEYLLVNTFVIIQSSLTSLSGNFSNIGAVGGLGNGSFQLLNNDGLVWDLSNFQGTPGIFNLFNTGGNVTYSGGMNFRSIITTFQINANLSSSEVDLLFNDLDNSGTMPQNSGATYIRILGEAAPPTSASATARANLTTRGFVVSHN